MSTSLSISSPSALVPPAAPAPGTSAVPEAEDAHSAVSPEAAAQNAQSQVLGSFNGPERAEFARHQDAVRPELSRIADVVEAHKGEVTASWRHKVSADLLLAASPAWSRRQFEDHIPEMILALCAKLRSWPDVASQYGQEQDTARAHSKHRWQQGYDMRSLARELGHLNACLLEVLDRFWIGAAQAEMQLALRVARSIVAEIILESTSESVTQYARLLQTEAAARARQMEAAIEALREEERWRGQVLREAAHDLRGSLGIVSGSASIIDRSQMKEEDRAEVGRILRRGVHSLHEMMTDLIDLARLEAGEERASSRLFDAAQLLRELGATALPLAQAKGLSLTIEAPPELKAWGDTIKVRRIAQNLLLNAIKYTRQGGVTMTCAPDGEQRWLLRVSDTGPGLNRSPASPLAHALQEATDASRQVEGRTEGEQNPAEKPNANFPDAPANTSPAHAPSTSTHDSQAAQDEGAQGEGADCKQVTLMTSVPGEGVGLSIVKRLCDLLGASLELDTRPGAGSTFRVLFTRTPSAQRPLQAMENEQATQSLS